MRSRILMCGLLLAWTVAGMAQAPAINNGGFEQGLSGWKAAGRVHAAFRLTPHTGLGLALFGAAVPTLIPELNSSGSLSTTIQLPPAPAYALQWWAMITTKETSTAARDTLSVEATAVGGGSPQTKVLSNADSGSAYVNYTLPLSAFAGRAVTITFRATNNATNGTVFRLDDVALQAVQTPTNITGTVTFNTHGVANADVSFNDTHVPTAPDGTFRISGMNCTAGVFSVSAAGFKTWEEASYAPVCGQTNIHNVMLALPPTAISGEVHDSDVGSPLTNARVTVLGSMQKTTTAGRFSFPNVLCQKLTMTVELAGYRTRQREMTPSCSQVNELSIPLDPELTVIAGAVKATDGPLPAATVTTSRGATTTSGYYGFFALNAVPCASTAVTASAPGYQTYTRELSLRCDETTIVNLPLVANPTAIRGRVMNAFNESPIDATITWGLVSATPNSDGTYRLDVSCSSNNLTATAPGYRKYVRFYEPTCGTTNVQDIAMTPLPDGTSLCGFVNDAGTGRAVAGILVQAGSASATTNALGSYCISPLSCATPVDVVASKPGYYKSLKPKTTINCGESNPLNMLIGEKSLSGKITDATGASLAGAQVTLGQDVTIAGARGEYVFHGICRSDTLKVTMPAHTSYSAKVTPNCDAYPAPKIDVTLDPSRTNVYVQITDRTNLQGKTRVREALVTWGPYTAASDDGGGYAFNDVLCQTAPLTIYTRRYGTLRYSVKATCDSSIVYPVDIKPISMEVRGLVRENLHSAPVAGATVTWVNGSATTDDTGSYRLETAACSSGTLTVTKEGYKTQSQNFATDCRADAMAGPLVTLVHSP